MSKKIQAEIIELKKENDELQKRLDELVKGTLILHDIIDELIKLLTQIENGDYVNIKINK